MGSVASTADLIGALVPIAKPGDVESKNPLTTHPTGADNLTQTAAEHSVACAPSERLLSSPRKQNFSLGFLLGLVTGVSAFFGLFAVSPIAAIVAVALLTPAMIRTGSVEHAWAFEQHHLNWSGRAMLFLHSVVFMLNSAGLATLAFCITCLISSAMGFAFGLVFGSPMSKASELALLGAAGGVVWGIAAGLVAIGWYWNRYWFPVSETEASPSSAGVPGRAR